VLLPAEKYTLMALTDSRRCIFCGEAPDEKTREHVIPYWLLAMTGDPRRVVPLGQDFSRGKQAIQFSWSNFVAPACRACNNSYAQLEERAKPHIERLLRFEALSVGDYIDVMDWLDKIRIGIWLTRHMIEKHPVEVTPNFYISSRVAAKDRMIAIHVIAPQPNGISLFGCDSLIFSEMPSCFGIRINEILILNVSFDFFCSAGCGLPRPRYMRQLMGGKHSGMLKLDGVICNADVSFPITDLRLHKPVVWIYQPIKLPVSMPEFKGGFWGHTSKFDSRIYERTMVDNDRQGALFRQFDDRVDILTEASSLIEFDSVTGDDCVPMSEIIASVYETQISLLNLQEYDWIDPNKPDEFFKEFRDLKISSATETANFYRKASSRT